ncbi:MAG: phosphoadenosine phosphosulfate reductase family protein [Desulfobacteraceae bacterium]|nr:phosphoadenosine phosphosulfate reductase family protein [Desulfobacteraceae bacterium]
MTNTVKAHGPKKNVKYIDMDVYAEAKSRVQHVLDTFDSVAVCFSGGKDSLVVLHLLEEVLRDRGWEGPADGKINVIFRDEELIPDNVINFVQEYAKNPKYNFYYYAVQLKSEKFILGKKYEYVQWDKNREWIRPKPEIAIVKPEDVVFDQYRMDAYCAQNFKGKIAFINGIRCDESLIRYRSVVNKRNECYIAGTDAPNVKFVKPIYDWSEKDVFKYLHDKNIKYCPIYDAQMWNGQALRVATPLHAESAKRFNKLRTLYPIFYEQLIAIFPEMLEQDRYWNEYDPYAVIAKYRPGFEGVIEYIKAEIKDPVNRKMAIKRVLEAWKIRKNNIAKGRGDHNFGGYPALHVFKSILGGNYKRVIQPIKKPSKADKEYEELIYGNSKINKSG